MKKTKASNDTVFTASSYFDVSGTDIAKLDDEQLRDLVGRLCEAECRLLGQSTKKLVSGGNQNAADGGFDVYLELSSHVGDNTYFESDKIGYQIKISDMPPAKIAGEMTINGVVKPSILELAKHKGCYIIVCSHERNTILAIKNRVAEMRRIIPEELRSEIILDFYDRDRLAIWVRRHPIVILWIRDAIKRPISGWQTFGNWSRSPATNDEFLLDLE